MLWGSNSYPAPEDLQGGRDKIECELLPHKSQRITLCEGKSHPASPRPGTARIAHPEGPSGVGCDLPSHKVIQKVASK